jgi:outer membrane protein TolC
VLNGNDIVKKSPLIARQIQHQILLALGLLSLVCGGRFARATDPLALTLTQAIRTAQEQSPDVRQVQEQYSSARAKVGLALAPSEPTLSFSNNDMTKQFSLGSSASNVIQVTESIGFPGRAVMNRSMLSQQAEAIQFQLQAMKLQVSVNVKTAYYNLQLARKNIELNADTRLAYERILSIAKRRYETGAAGQVDYLNAQVTLLANNNDLADLQTAERQARGQLNVLLKKPVDAELAIEPIKMVYHPKIELNKALEAMIERRNEIQAARSQEHATQRAVDLAWLSILPDFQITLGTTDYRKDFASPYNATGAAGYPTRTYSAGIQFTVPLFAIFNERQVIAGASHDHAAAERNLDILFNQSKAAMESTVDTIHSSEIKIENFEKHLLPLSEQALNLALIDYSSGKADFPTLAATAAARRQARLSYATAVVAYLTNYAAYGQLIGEDLQ